MASVFFIGLTYLVAAVPFGLLVAMKVVVDLPSRCPWKEGTVIHTIGYPEPEIFGFLYVLPGGVASMPKNRGMTQSPDRGIKPQ